MYLRFFVRFRLTHPPSFERALRREVRIMGNNKIGQLAYAEGKEVVQCTKRQITGVETQIVVLEYHIGQLVTDSPNAFNFVRSLYTQFMLDGARLWWVYN